MRIKLCHIIFIVGLIVIKSHAQTGPSTHPTEYQVKAAFLYNFAKFVEWPGDVLTDSNDPIKIGVIGDDPFGTDLDETIKGKTVKDRELVIERFHQIQELEFCHILFIGSPERKSLLRILERLKKFCILTVGETEEFTRYGGMIRFLIVENRVRFEINVEAIDQAGLKISSKILKLAKIYQEK